MKNKFRFILYCLIILGFNSCKKERKSQFVVKNSNDTGIKFSNDLKANADLNIFNYMYFYNGGGVGAGDLNNDGQIDLVFVGNQVNNQIYINKGKLKFEECSKASNINQNKGWATGVSLVDINQDGKLDIYINQVGKFETLNNHNLLFICDEIDKNGIPHYSEKSSEYGLDFVGFGTQTAFFDFDLDGDLDIYQLNHSVHQNGTFGKREVFENTFHPLAGDRFFENINGKYLEITKDSKINSSAIGYGLGITLSDVNLDGYTDLYIGNDFHENDYLYINQKNKSFSDEMGSRINHTSRFTMGVDIADLNNDIFPEIFTLDMLPYDPEILKRSEGEDVYYNFDFKLKQGYNVQFARNNLQLNNKNGYFSEIGMYSGVHATDWSWSTLLFDFENDGQKDIFISNGINKRMNDLDYINFVSSDEIQEKISKKQFDESDESLIDLLPEIKIPNKFFSNSEEMKFSDISENIEGNTGTFSNGAIYSDLDNDGDLDVITNNINQEAFLYENQSNVLNPENKSLKINLKGPKGNLNSIGSKCLVYSKDKIYYQEKYPIKGFLSSMETPIFVGLGKNIIVDSVVVIWPNNSFEVVKNQKIDKSIDLNYRENLPKFDYTKLNSENAGFINLAKEYGLDFTHKENQFNEFDREALIPNKMSTEGPAVAVGDLNKDGLEDIYLGSSKWEKSKIYFQKPNSKFSLSIQKDLEADSTFEDVDAKFIDFNNDGFLDIVIVSGGNEYFAKSEYLHPRLYLNNKKGEFKKDKNAFKNLFINASVICTADINKDGYQDIFFGGRSIPWAYGDIPKSYLLVNNKKGGFDDFTEKYAPELSKIGFVKNAKFVDYDKDQDQDLIVALEWDGIYALKNDSNNFKKVSLTNKKGWWNFAEPIDVDNDGDLDFVCGNLGENSRIHATEDEPVRMYVNDFDDNGRLDQVISIYMQGKETIFADKREIEKQLPYVKKEFIMATDFAKASIKEVFGKSKINDSKVYEANYFKNAILINNGKDNFELKPLKNVAQMSSFYAFQEIDYNHDKLPDFIMMGNFFDCNIQMGLYDADHGNIFINKGKGEFNSLGLQNLPINGQVRRIRPIKVGNKLNYLIVRNNDGLMVLNKPI